MVVEVENQVITDDYCLYHGDCIEGIKGLHNDSIGFSIFSPPFADLYAYSDDYRDLSNCKSYEEFFEHFGFLAKELLRVMMPGRVVAVHCMDLPTYKRSGEEIGCKDFSGDIVRLFRKVGFVYHCPRITIWKDPLVAATRTKAIGLAHKQIVKDSSMCRTGFADYIIAFRKKGENPKPVSHKQGLTQYHGARNVPSNFDMFEDWEGEQKVNKRSHWIWQRYASPVWDDIRQTYVLPYREAKGNEDEKHICPLQLDAIERCVELWSVEGDIVLTPFMGVGSEVYVAVKNGRKGVGFELKGSYFKQAVRNVKQAKKQRAEGFML